MTRNTKFLILAALALATAILAATYSSVAFSSNTAERQPLTTLSPVDSTVDTTVPGTSRPAVSSRPSSATGQAPAAANCNAAYPTVCIPNGPDLDCGQIPDRNFAVPGADPYRFDADHNGIGCEVDVPTPRTSEPTVLTSLPPAPTSTSSSSQLPTTPPPTSKG
ncbi:hypothetical protein D5S17_32410 [Pseudonocardiaceae bacterium YIM PH 21723]|nr:hypothetical protein D5S17_32410 [Pseudonocardiaceae bacterium YIM PH 21723]